MIKQENGISGMGYKSGKCGYENEVFDEDGNVLTDESDILERWRRYYDKLLNCETPIGDNIEDYLSSQKETIQYKFDNCGN